MILETKNLIIRDYQDDDRNDLSRICADNEVMKLVFNGPVPVSKFDDFVAENFCSSKIDIGLEVVCNKINNEIMGFAGFHRFLYYLTEEYEIEFGFVLGKKWHNKGFATEIGKKQIHYALNNLKCRKVFARAHPENLASIYVITEKLGLKQVSDEVVENRFTFISTKIHLTEEFYNFNS